LFDRGDKLSLRALTIGDILENAQDALVVVDRDRFGGDQACDALPVLGPHLQFETADTIRLLDLSVEPLLRLVGPKSKLARRAPDELLVAEPGYLPERVIHLDQSKMIERRNRDRHRNKTERRREPLLALAQRALCLLGPGWERYASFHPRDCSPFRQPLERQIALLRGVQHVKVVQRVSEDVLPGQSGHFQKTLVALDIAPVG